MFATTIPLQPKHPALERSSLMKYMPRIPRVWHDYKLGRALRKQLKKLAIEPDSLVLNEMMRVREKPDEDKVVEEVKKNTSDDDNSDPDSNSAQKSYRRPQTPRLEDISVDGTTPVKEEANSEVIEEEVVEPQLRSKFKVREGYSKLFLVEDEDHPDSSTLAPIPRMGELVAECEVRYWNISSARDGTWRATWVLLPGPGLVYSDDPAHAEFRGDRGRGLEERNLAAVRDILVKLIQGGLG